MGIDRYMNRKCVKCTKSIAGKGSVCIACDKPFHPGCVRAYIVSRTASAYCKASLSDMPLTPRDISDTPVFSFASPGAASSEGGTSTLPGSSFQFTNKLLLRLVEQGKQSDERISSFASCQLQSNREINDKLDQFVTSQLQMNREINDKLDHLQRISEVVEQNRQRITDLERNCAALPSEVHSLRATLSDTASAVRPHSPVHEANKLIISSVPSAITMSPSAFVNKLFNLLQITELVTHILDVRTITKAKSPVSQSRTSLNVTQATNVRLL